MVAVSVVIASRDPGPALVGLVRSLDAQTLPAAEFEVVVADDSTDGSAGRLLELEGRRSNVVVVAAAPDADRLALARRHASGDHVLELDQDLRLAPRALELLLDRARESGVAVVRGRVAGGRGRRIALVRAGAETSEVVDLDSGYACALQDVEPVPVPDGVAITAATIRWESGLLRVDAGVTGHGGEARLLVANDVVELEVPATLGDGTASAALDLRTAEAGRPLGDGVWSLRLRLSTPAGLVDLPLPSGRRVAAVIDGRPSVVRAGESGAEVDAGATATPVAGAAPRETATVVESARGILLTLDQPALHVHGDGELDARLLLDSFALRARLVCRDGSARVEALASSLAGVSRIALGVGGGKPVQTGLRLRVDGVGAMTVEAVPPSKPKAPPAAPAGPPRLVQRIRRRAPEPLEPVVRRLSRVPVLRRAYRSLMAR
ncbi:glycosyltransferase family 2 protein [Amnibacterium kyonggiense]|uniref:Glycosyl transferase family 2 n=2 Tax=Amnibacterium kyonggiense TaxID=595671 RepID=A0A4R7FSK0_9MICO|nr:glycosyltransferase [Amnibacterium kyonggiense]TDS80810.1 glycosyl transferase family 2 [Amnibacterium kyonggiense]